MKNDINNRDKELRIKNIYQAFNQSGGTIHQLVDKINNNVYLTRNYKFLGYKSPMYYLLDLFDCVKWLDIKSEIKKIKFGGIIKHV